MISNHPLTFLWIPSITLSYNTLLAHREAFNMYPCKIWKVEKLKSLLDHLLTHLLKVTITTIYQQIILNLCNNNMRIRFNNNMKIRFEGFHRQSQGLLPVHRIDDDVHCFRLKSVCWMCTVLIGVCCADRWHMLVDVMSSCLLRNSRLCSIVVDDR